MMYFVKKKKNTKSKGWGKVTFYKGRKYFQVLFILHYKCMFIVKYKKG